MIKCKHCDIEKLESDMSIWNGKPSKVCLECKKTHPTGRGAAKVNGGGSPEKKRPAAARKPRAAADLELALPAGGHGFTAVVTEEDTLLITQENDGAADDNIVLTKHEARQLFDKFGEWIVES